MATGVLRPHAKQAVATLFEKHATNEASGKGLKIGKFNRFYGEILFRPFDANDNGTLQMEYSVRHRMRASKRDFSRLPGCITSLSMPWRGGLRVRRSVSLKAT